MSLCKDHVEKFHLASPIEEEFYRIMMKYLDDKAAFFNQYTIKSGKYTLHVDFVVIMGHEKIGFECDGKPFHDFDRDEYRDKKIVSGGHLNSVVRIRGEDINFKINDVMYVLSRWYPHIFSDRGMDNIERLASETCKEGSIYHSYARVFYRGDLDREDGGFGDGFGSLTIRRCTS